MIVKIFFSSIVVAISFWLLKNSKAKNDNDYTLANRNLSSSGVSYVIIGTLVGGASTVGTVQLAYVYGLSAWIFTLFSGVACLLLGLFFSKPLREKEVVTVSEFIGIYFGRKIQKYTSFFSSLGMYVHIIAQFLAVMSIFITIYNINKTSATLISFIVITVFVIKGGITSSSFIGKIKVFLMYFLLLTSTVIALVKTNFGTEIFSNLTVNDIVGIKGYGISKAAIDSLSMVIGVLSTQTYLQAIFSAKDIKTAQKGAFFSAALIPPVGIMGVIIGLFMRIHHPGIKNTTLVFAYFLKDYLNPFVAAFFMAALAIIIIGTAAGLTLGVTTNLYVDFIKNRFKGNSLKLIRSITLIVLLTAAVIVLSGLDSTILDYSYMSMGLRGTSVFIPLLIILFFKNRKAGNLKLLSTFYP
ncbi:sodium:solute symporter family protein [Hippea jasoniae]|uniref:sodium:solute symporter family protein n=1 Tax=Hippea jasoniae TaxID=944479 RepID=UPI0018DDD183|nr:sodium:solute symporter family protein [Hippea jasoniae]